ncbi:membrane protein [Microbacterium phage Nebulous]|nr:membrane protein [Microbacterium phage Nebulous]
MVINKYLAGLLTVAVLFITAFQAAVQDGITVTEAWQLAGMFVGAIVTTFVPITPGKWAASLKVLGAVIGAGIAALIPFLTTGWDASAITIVVLAVVNTLAVQLGVNVRVDYARAALADPNKSDAPVLQVDPKAAVAAEATPKQKIA